MKTVRSIDLTKNHDAVQSLNNHGYFLQAQGDLAGTKPYHEHVLHVFRLRLGQEHSFMQTTQSILEA